MAPTEARSGGVGARLGSGGAARSVLLVAVLGVLPLSNAVAVSTLRSHPQATGAWWAHHAGLLRTRDTWLVAALHATVVALLLVLAARGG